MGSTTMHQNNSTFPLSPPPVLSSTVDHVHLERERMFFLHSLQTVISTFNRLVANQGLRAGMVVPNLSIVILNQKLQRALDSLEAEARNNTTDRVGDGLRVYLIKSIHVSALSSLTGIQDKTGLCGNRFLQIAHLTNRLLSVERRIEEALINNGTILSPYSSSSAGMDPIINSLRDTLRSQGFNFLSSPSPPPSPSPSPSPSIAAANSSINRSSTTTSAVRIRFVTEYSPSSRALRPSEAGQATNFSHGARGTTTTDERLKRKSIVDSEKGEVCSVCLEEIKGRDENGKATMGCSHTFHFSCILQWMKRKHNCPICRYDVNPEKIRRRRC